jgi:ATP-dependent phosphofructokinase / diphosphate-dependent phosphofructokinase
VTAGRALIIAQSGGPTAVVNASLVGALEAARADARVGSVLGARFGVEGILNGDVVGLTDLTAQDVATLRRTPGAALGSARHRPADGELSALVSSDWFGRVQWIVLVGGNDTAETLHRLHAKARAAGRELNVVGIPKTIDNDLPGMDHCPGYGSAARFVALAAREAALDTAAMRKTDPVKIVEVMGRNAGWLAAASALGRNEMIEAPHLIFLPERPRAVEQMLEEIRSAQAAHGWALVAISENQRDDRGKAIGGGESLYVDPHGHAYYESAGAALARMSQERLGIRTRYERPGSHQRTSALTISEVDLDEAEAAGAEAVRRALGGESDVMVAIQRADGPDYAPRYTTIPLESVAHQERLLPDAFIASSGTDVTDAFLAYARPLIGGPLPPIHRLQI